MSVSSNNESFDHYQETKDLMETRFNAEKMRLTLLDGLRNEAIKYFPTTGGRSRAIEAPLSVVKKAVVK